MSNPLDHLLTAVFADTSPEGGGYAAAPLPLSPWVRLVRGALTDKGGTHGVLRIRASNPTTIQYKHGSKSLEVTRGNVAAYATNGDLGIGWPKLTVADVSGSILNAIFDAAGYQHDGYTLRATSPTDITLSLSGETVTAEFNPPLKATAPVLLGLVKATRPIPRIKATERQMTIEIDGYSDQVIPLTDPPN